jgi:excisionase family DNA binding protein
MPSLLLKVPDAATELGVSRAKLWQWVADGRIRSVKIDGMRRIRRVDLEEFIDGLGGKRAQTSRRST